MAQNTEGWGYSVQLLDSPTLTGFECANKVMFFYAFLTWFRDVILSKPPLGVVLPRLSEPEVPVDRSALIAGGPSERGVPGRGDGQSHTGLSGPEGSGQGGAPPAGAEQSPAPELRPPADREPQVPHTQLLPPAARLPQPHPLSGWIRGRSARISVGPTHGQLGCDNKVMNPACLCNFFVQLQTNQSMSTRSPQQNIIKAIWQVNTYEVGHLMEWGEVFLSFVKAINSSNETERLTNIPCDF